MDMDGIGMGWAGYDWVERDGKLETGYRSNSCVFNDILIVWCLADTASCCAASFEAHTVGQRLCSAVLLLFTLSDVFCNTNIKHPSS